jgi:hypothetical protein
MTYTQGFPKKWHPDSKAPREIERAGQMPSLEESVEVVPLSDAERLREALERIGDKRVPKLLEKTDAKYHLEWARWAHELARTALGGGRPAAGPHPSWLDDREGEE